MKCIQILGLLLFAVSVFGEAPQEYSTGDEYSSISYADSYLPQSEEKSAPYPAAKAAPYPARSVPTPAKVYGPPSYSYGTPAPVAVVPAPAPATGSGPGPTGGTGPGPSASGPGPSGPGPSGPGPSALGPGPSGPGPFGPGPFGPGPLGFGGPGPFGFGPGPFPYAYGPLGFKKGLIAFLLTKVKVGFKYLEFLLAPIGTITTLMNVLNFLKIKVVPKLATKFHELQVHPQAHDVAEVVSAASRRYKRSMEELDSLTQRVLSAIEKNLCTEKLVCQIGKTASHMVSVDSNWVTSTLGMLKKIESPNSLISIFRESMSNVISDCNVILCKNVNSTVQTHPIESNNLDKDTAKTLLDEDEGIEDDNGNEEDEESSQNR